MSSFKRNVAIRGDARRLHAVVCAEILNGGGLTHDKIGNPPSIRGHIDLNYAT